MSRADSHPPRAGGLPAVWSPDYEMEIGDHVFPTHKYRLVLDRLLREGILHPANVHRPDPAPYRILERVHTERYLRKLRDGDFDTGEIWRMEIPFSGEIRRAFRRACAGTILAGELALEHGLAIHLGGGFHHAFPDHAEGFCLLNDVAVGLRELRARGAIARATVVDCDVHHGNGTAATLADQDWAFTLSLHQEGIYPVRKPPGDLDVGLPAGTGDASYLARLDSALAPAVDDHGPDLVLYLAGADPYRRDQLGGLGLTRDGLERRDRCVLERCRVAGAPVAILLAGGYAHRLDDTVAIHRGTASAARDAMVARESGPERS